MAEVLTTMVVKPLVSMVIEKAYSHLLDQYKVMEGMEEQHKLLKRKLPAVLDVITDAEEQAVKNRVGAKAWLQELREVAYKANDVLDEFKYEALRRKAKAEGHYKEFGMDVIKLFPSHCRFVFRCRMAKKLHKILQEIDVLIADMNTFRFKFKPQPPMSMKWRQTDPNISDSSLFSIASDSRAEEKNEIVDKLRGQKENMDLTVLPIVGMGGMGKTTLAKLVYNDSSIQELFRIRLWVCVSKNFDVNSLAKRILEEANKVNGSEALGTTTLDKFQNAVRGKRYLLILDDVWNREAYKWAELRSYLHLGGIGNSVVTTTRDENVAQIMGTIKSHKIKGLDVSIIEKIIKTAAFDSQVESIADQKHKMVGDVAKRCSGCPLAATALGFVLRTKNTVQEWEAVLNRSTICDDENGILPILKLSYNCLPSHMQQCFAFCAMFPKGHEIDVEMLIRLWMANSFIPEQQGVCPEVTGKQIFNELAERSFFQEVKKDKFCRQITCKIHDLMHDLAQDSMGKECVAICAKLNKSEDFPYTARHLFLSVDIPEKDLNPSPEKKSLAIQTLICERSIEDDLQRCDGSTKDDLQHLLPQCKSIRALKTRLGSSPIFDIGDPHLVLDAGDPQLVPNAEDPHLVMGEEDPHLAPDAGSARQKHGFSFIRHIFGKKRQRREIETTATHFEQLQLQYGNRQRVPNRPSFLETKYLHHLRYLDLSGSDMKEVPEEITILYHLQTLNLSDCCHLEQLPMTMKYMTTLRHLYTHGCPELKSMPPDLGHLTSLQTLTCFVAGSIGSGCSNLGELEKLDLGGQLELSHLENVTRADAKKANLRNKRKLEELKLSWDSAIDHDTEGHTVAQHKELLEGLKPHNRLKALRMDYYGGRACPTWMLELQLVVELKLCNCKNLEKLPALWKLTALQFLILDNLENLHSLRIEDCSSLEVLPKAESCRSAFPALRKMELHHLEKFHRWETVEGEQATFPSLEELIISGCPKLITFPEAPKLSILSLWNCSEQASLQAASRYITSVSSLKMSVKSDSDSVEQNSIELVVRGHDSPMEVLSLTGCLVFFSHSSAWEIWKCFGKLTCLEFFQCNDLVYWPENLFQGLISLQTLKISWCSSLTGVTKEEASHKQSAPKQSAGLLLPCLESLEINGCGSLEQIPNLRAPCLKTLHISVTNRLRSVGFRQQEAAQPADTSSSLIVPVSSSADNHYCFFPCLQSLQIACCDGLTEVVSLPPSIKTLKIWLCRDLVSLSGEVPSLEELNIHFCQSLQSFPIGPYSSLRVLNIDNCESIKELQGCVDHLGDKGPDSRHLQEQVELDSKLKSKSDGTTTAVVLLKSSSTNSNHCLFTCLESLTVYKCHGLTNVANLPPSIKTLYLWSCKNLVSVSAEVPLLEELRIGFCEKLEFLPNGPDNQVYSSLRILEIVYCGIKLFTGNRLRSMEFDEQQDCKRLVSREGVAQPADTSSSASADNLDCFFPCLESLQIDYCSGLTEVANLPPSIKTLKINYCSLITLSGAVPLLEELDICDCKSLEFLPNGPHQVYSSLRVLKIDGCPGIKQLPLSLQQRLDLLEEKKLDPHLLQEPVPTPQNTLLSLMSKLAWFIYESCN